MNLNDMAINTMASNHIKKYLHDINHKFSLSEVVTLICNNSKSIAEEKEMLLKCMDKKNLEESGYEFDEEINNKINDICRNIDAVFNMISENDREHVILFDDQLDIPRAVVSLERLKQFLNDHVDSVDELTISICNIVTGEIVCYISLNNEFVPTCYNNVAIEPVDLESNYIDIPNDFHIGDIVKFTGDSQQLEYVVICDSEVPSDSAISRSTYNYIDSCITVVPKKVLNGIKENTYAEYINIINKNRINNISMEIAEDVLMKNHEHFPITCVEK